MDQINIILNNSNHPLTDASGNIIRNCPHPNYLGNIGGIGGIGGIDDGGEMDISCNSARNYFKPWKSYVNPVTWQEIIVIIILKIFFIVIFLWNEYFGWVLVYLLTVGCIAYFIYLASVFDYSYLNFVKVSNDSENPWNILWALVMNILFYIVLYLSNIPLVSRPWVIVLAEIGIWTLFFYYCLADLYRVLFHKHLLLDIANALGVGLAPPCNPDPVNTTHTNKPQPTTPKKEVFNIAGDQFTYKDAQAVCKSYGADLANYEQIEQAYQDGAEWVSYGWSEGQYAYFPLQKSTWEKMSQDNPENANGKVRPGISGGFFANPDMLFGANCFGVKPKPRSQDLMFNLPGNSPGTEQDSELEDKVNYYKKHADQIKVVGFNTQRWFEDPKEKTD